MVQLKILSGSQSGSTHVARQFPISIGRAANATLRLTDTGVWERHLELSFQPEGFRLRLCNGALASVNGAPFQEVLLRNGDTIVCGAVTMRFWLAEVTQRNFTLREVLTWLALGALTIGQCLLINWLLS